ncbi:hypothetical protein F8S09_15215 [Deinococcus sp. SDU3-2]|uniref:DUF7683 domain-containing protein n=1 Tax=Deinococcus terrestris TaxID=2651870 RepID=A0A7X1TT31_9DEIO|nr:hypothetical protein [Deinococcus terrestris]MPY68007.1 hypothetical protein [Deinococcus terrestris]
MAVVFLLECYDRGTEQLVMEWELPRAAAEELRDLFEPGETVFPYLFGLYPVTTDEHLALLERWCPEVTLDFRRWAIFVTARSA